MVTNSRINYNQYLKDVYNLYCKKFPNRIYGVKKFIKKIKKSYDPHQLSFLPHKYLFFLFGKKNYLKKNNQSFWIAFVGKKGGEGKSTLCSQTLYFLDNSMNEKRIGLTYDDFIKIIPAAKKTKKYPSIQLDEPENKTHALSSKGREMRDILEKVRQLNLCVGVCANSLRSIPSFIYERLNCIIYLDKFKFWLWDEIKDAPKFTIIDDIKKEFSKTGHAAFKNKEILNRAYFKHLGFCEKLPFEVKEYLKKKQDDLLKDINNYNNTHQKEKEKEISNYDVFKKIYAKTPNIKPAEIVKVMAINRRTFYKYKEKYQQEFNTQKISAT